MARVEADGVPVHLPPYAQALATLNYTIRLQRRIGFVLLLGATGLFVYQQSTIYSLTKDLRAKDFLVVPGAADFVSVRPNLIGDRTVIAFARYFTERMVSIGYSDIEQRHRELEKYMTPALRAHMARELGPTVDMFRALQVTEVATVDGVEAERTTLESGKSGFVATLKITVSRYLGERKHKTREEVVTAVFQTSALSSDEPWLFEVVEFVRRTPEEHRAYVVALRTEKK